MSEIIRRQTQGPKKAGSTHQMVRERTSDTSKAEVKSRTSTNSRSTNSRSRRDSLSRSSSLGTRTGIFRGRHLPGQLGFNPFFAFVGCCDGTCTVQYGCVVLGIVQMFLGFYFGLYHGMKLLRPDAEIFVTRSFCGKMDAVSNKILKEEKQIQHQTGIAGEVLFGYLSGILLLYSAMKLNKYTTAAYCGLMLIGGFYYLLLGVHFIGRLDDRKNFNPKWDCNWRLVHLLRISFLFFGQTFWQCYCMACSAALWLQIHRAIYEALTNQDTESVHSDDEDNSFLPQHLINRLKPLPNPSDIGQVGEGDEAMLL